ncbi:MAG: hypothetical protein QME92_00045 [Bacillota bacterium]|nr:hypothetical protein [Bacillota bacterium]
MKHEATLTPDMTPLECAYAMVTAYLLNLQLEEERELTPQEDEARRALNELLIARDRAELEAKWREEARQEREERRKAKRLAKGGVWRASD